MNTKEKKIVRYDENCKLCISSMRFINKVDRKKKFIFKPLEANEMSDEPVSEGEKNSGYGSIILETNGRKLSKSSAILQIFKELGFPWSILAAFTFIPKFVRDGIYNFIAKRRYYFFGVVRSNKS